MTVLSLILQALAGLLLADFLTGVFHWLEDRYGRESWPVLGPLVIAPNRLHHEQPLAFTRSGFLSRNWTCAVAAGLIGLPLLAVSGPSIWLAMAFVFGALANEFHFWSHCPDRAPTIAHMLRAIGLMQPRGHHARHHAAPHDRCYCVLTTWLNPLLDHIGLWSRLERLLPKRWQA
ncbi:fatty acid desaturase CarF family protein [Novosphingobium naphthalenivorans]|uniref:fatty acid desaturase CarF family protein n=1 Tax=Novosphingobium naphthalenivorans TaxID=273168 RepID=UPI00082CF467|nr:fatty acid desaturase CarF family protein [Novosphingobium naphthalenivorans]